MKKTNNGRPCSYSVEVADKICQLIAEGGNINRIAGRNGIPGQYAIYDWLEKFPAFATKYARARKFRAEARSDRIDEIKDMLLAGGCPADVARVAIDVEKWQAGRESSYYRDKDNSVNVNVVSVDMDLSEASRRLAFAINAGRLTSAITPTRESDIIDAHVEEIDDK